MAYTHIHTQKAENVWPVYAEDLWKKNDKKHTRKNGIEKKKSPAPDENWKTMMAMTITNEEKFTGHQRQKYQESKTFDLITLSRKIHLFCAFVRINLFIWKDGRFSFLFSMLNTHRTKNEWKTNYTHARAFIIHTCRTVKYNSKLLTKMLQLLLNTFVRCFSPVFFFSGSSTTIKRIFHH